MFVRATLLLPLIILTACSLDTEHAGCPCLAGYRCCQGTNTCVPEGQACERRWTSMASGTAEHLAAVWGSSLTDIHAVGWNGTLLHFDGESWAKPSSPTTEQVASVWGFDRSHVLASGDNGILLYYNGSSWAKMDSGVAKSMNAVWGTRFEDAFAVGNSSTILHFDGFKWTPISSPIISNLLGIRGTDSKNIFAVAADGNIIHFDGASWTAMQSGIVSPLHWVSPGASDVLAGGEGVVVRYDGTSWRKAAFPYPAATVAYDACHDGKEIVIVGELDPVYFKVPGEPGSLVLHYDGTRWSELDPGTARRLNGVWCKDGVAIVVGHYGTILRYGP